MSHLGQRKNSKPQRESGVWEQVMGNLYVQQDLCGFSSVLRYGKRRHGSVGKK